MTSLYRNVHRVLFVVFSCTTFFPAAFAQTHDKPGYYVNPGGDTIRGLFIGFKETTMTPAAFSFQPTNGSPIQLNPTDCRMAFLANSGVYIAYQGKRLTNTTDYHDATTDTADVFEDISTFLPEIYNDGKYRLYQYSNGKRSNFYMATGNGPLQELYYKEMLNNGEAVESQAFRLQLTALFLSELQIHPQRQMEVNAVTYDAWHLVRLFASLTGSANRTVHSDEKYPVEVYVGGGIANSGLNVTVGSVYGIGGYPDWAGSYPSSSSLLVEAGLKVPLHMETRKLSLMLRLDYFNFKHAHTFDDGTVTRFKSNDLSIPMGIAYKLVQRPSYSVEISAGPAIHILSSDSATQVDNTGTETSGDPKTGFLLGWFAEASVGVVNRVYMFAGYYTSVSISRSQEVNATHQSLRAGVRVRVF